MLKSLFQWGKVATLLVGRSAQDLESPLRDLAICRAAVLQLSDRTNWKILNPSEWSWHTLAFGSPATSRSTSNLRALDCGFRLKIGRRGGG